MTSFNKLNEYHHAEQPARAALRPQKDNLPKDVTLT